jgi:calcineurin-like phosphoesterase
VRFEPASGGIFLSAVFIEIDVETGLALSLTQEIYTEDE